MGQLGSATDILAALRNAIREIYGFGLSLSQGHTDRPHSAVVFSFFPH